MQGVSNPTQRIPLEEFYTADPRRGGSRVLSYGSAWRFPGWTESAGDAGEAGAQAPGTPPEAPDHGPAGPTGTEGEVRRVVELLWISATRELVALYITYDFARLHPGRLTQDSVLGSVAEFAVDAGQGVGRMLGDLDLATSDVQVEVLAELPGDLACHELLWDWRWRQHHRDGLMEVRRRIAQRSSPRREESAAPGEQAVTGIEG